MNVLKPINPIERKILKDKEFLNAITIGKPRQGHTEGTIKKHIINILEYIEENYRKTKYYEILRIIAMLHDTGKFAFLEETKSYQPQISKKELDKLFGISRKFKKRYYKPKTIPIDLIKHELSSKHTQISYQFSKKFLKDKRILKIIRYHDLAFDLMCEYRDTGKYDIKLFKKVFSDINIPLYLAFLKCDNCIRIDNTTEWFKKELKRNSITIDK